MSKKKKPDDIPKCRRCDKEFWLSENGLDVIASWSREGLSQRQIATKMGIGETTLYEWRKTSGRLAECLTYTREMAVKMVENALFKKCLGYTVKLNVQRTTKDGEVVDCEEEQHIPVDEKAIEFFLKNRNPEQWKDKVEATFTGSVNLEADSFTKSLKSSAPSSNDNAPMDDNIPNVKEEKEDISDGNRTE